MQENVLVINCGSSSVKFSLINAQTEQTMLTALAEKLTSDDAQLTIKYQGSKVTQAIASPHEHQQAINQFVLWLGDNNLLSTVIAVGHRVVHGGEKYSQPTLITSETKEEINALSKLAPLHNPANLQGIIAAETAFLALSQVAVFDTAFHQSLPQESYLYGLPFKLYNKSAIRRYGFHGSSHEYVSIEATKILNKPSEETQLITVHLGNGCSISAINGGKSVDTSLGFTPLEGLIMGTRCGDIDPSIIFYLHQQEGMSIGDIETLLNKESGLLGISELSNDCRTLEQAEQDGNAQAALALEMFSRKAAKTIASFLINVNQLDAIVFTGGIGENSSFIRKKIIGYLAALQIDLDQVANEETIRGKQGVIGQGSHTKCLVIPTDEEAVIARHTLALINSESRGQQ